MYIALLLGGTVVGVAALGSYRGPGFESRGVPEETLVQTFGEVELLRYQIFLLNSIKASREKLNAYLMKVPYFYRISLLSSNIEFKKAKLRIG